MLLINGIWLWFRSALATEFAMTLLVPLRCLSAPISRHNMLKRFPLDANRKMLCSSVNQGSLKKVPPAKDIDSINGDLEDIWTNLKTKRGQKYTILMSSITVFAGFMTGAYLAKYSANILNFLGLYVYSDDSDDKD